MEIMFLVIMSICCKASFGYLGAQVYRSVFKDYIPGIRPQCVHNQPTDIQTDFALRQIIQLDEPTQLLYSILWIRLAWEDCRLKWNQSDFADIDNIRVPRAYVWIPDITLYDNSADKLSGMNDYIASVSSDGQVRYNFCSMIRSVCAVDVTYFPFDYQMCNFTFGSWAYSGVELDFHNKSMFTDMSSYVQNSEWIVHKLPIIRKVTHYSDVPYPTLTLHLLLERRPLFYVCNLLFPCFLISSVAALGFLLPPTSGEKVSLQITVLLSLSVFQLIVLDLMPPGGTASFIGLFFIVSMVLVGVSCLATVVVLNIHYKGVDDHKPLPGWVRRYLYTPLARLTRVSSAPDKGFCLNTKSNFIQATPYNVSLRVSDCDNPSPVSEVYTVSEHVLTSPQPSPKRPVSVTLSEVDGEQRVESSRKVINENVSKLLDRMNNYTNKIYHIASIAEGRDTGQNDWHNFALVVDRLFMMIYVLLMVAISLTMGLRFIVLGQTAEDWMQ